MQAAVSADGRTVCVLIRRLNFHHIPGGTSALSCNQ
jgi:hypothetical protein